MVGGVVAGMGVYADVAGPVGRALDTALATALGWGRYVAPIGLVALGVLLVRGHRDDDEAHVGSAHVWVGGLLVALSAAGLLHLAGGRPGLDAPTDDLGGAGGLLGVAIGGPLASGVAPWGAALVLAVLALAGLVVLTRTPVRVAAESAADGVRPAGTAVLDGLRRARHHLFSLRGDTGDGDELDDDGFVHVYDQDADEVHDEEPEEHDPMSAPAPDPSARLGLRGPDGRARRSEGAARDRARPGRQAHRLEAPDPGAARPQQLAEGRQGDDRGGRPPPRGRPRAARRGDEAGRDGGRARRSPATSSSSAPA